MPAFRYKAIDAKGAVVKGTSESGTLEALTDQLKQKGLFLMESQIEKAPVLTSDPLPKKTAVLDLKSPISVARGSRAVRPTIKTSKIPLALISIFSTQFSIMLKTGVPIAETLTSLGRQQSNSHFKAIIQDVTQRVQEGNSVSSAMACYPQVFDQVYYSLISAGETSGSLPLMLERISEYLEFQRDLKSKVRSALLYPTIIVLTSISVVAFLVIFILPTFATMFSELSMRLPLPTRILLALSQYIRNWWYMYLIGITGGWIYLARWLASPLHVTPVDTIQLKLPVLGKLVRNIVMTRVLRTLSALVSSGVPILHSLKLASEAADNQVFHSLLNRVYRDASEGKGLSASLFNNPYIPDQVAHMIANGERSGTLPEVLTKISDFYEKETDTALRNAFSVLEPIFVLLLGAIIAGIAISIMLPIFQMNNLQFG